MARAKYAAAARTLPYQLQYHRLTGNVKAGGTELGYLLVSKCTTVLHPHGLDISSLSRQLINGHIPLSFF